jgi:hypothetical protein
MRAGAQEPFVFYTTAHIVELTGRTARTVAELRDGSVVGGIPLLAGPGHLPEASQ